MTPGSVASHAMVANGSGTVRTLHVIQGEQCVSDDPDVVLSTILGSCVSACIRDQIALIGGMNHFLLPGDIEGTRSGASERYGVHAMELLVNALLSRGASRRRLEAKVFGGAAIQGLTDMGMRNAEFAVSFLRREGIPIVNECVRGTFGRRVQYWPVSGRARRQFLPSSEIPMPPVLPSRAAASEAGALELF